MLPFLIVLDKSCHDASAAVVDSKLVEDSVDSVVVGEVVHEVAEHVLEHEVIERWGDNLVVVVGNV